MIVSCPSCSVRFSLDESALGPEGRKVRCSKCSNVWVQFPDRQSVVDSDDSGGPTAPPQIADSPAGAAENRPARRGVERARRRVNRSADKGDGAAGAWAGLGLLALLILGGGYWYRAAIMHSLPATEILYSAVGLGPESPYEGLDLTDIKWKQEVSATGVKVLKITGKVVNNSDKVRAIPSLNGILLDKRSRPLRRWSFVAPEARLLPGEDVVFNTRVSNPDASATRLTIKLSENGKSGEKAGH